jgi:hypothetical protein
MFADKRRHVEQLRNHGQDTMADLCGPLLNGRHLVLDRGQLILKGLLGLSSAFNDSRSKTQQRDLTKNTEPVRANVTNLPSITTWKSVAASLAFSSTSSSFFFRSTASLYACCAMASLTRWISCTASTWAYSFASRAAAASVCTLAASHRLSVRACARSERYYINKQAK